MDGTNFTGASVVTEAVVPMPGIPHVLIQHHLFVVVDCNEVGAPQLAEA